MWLKLDMPSDIPAAAEEMELLATLAFAALSVSDRETMSKHCSLIIPEIAKWCVNVHIHSPSGLVLGTYLAQTAVQVQHSVSAESPPQTHPPCLTPAKQTKSTKTDRKIRSVLMHW